MQAWALFSIKEYQAFDDITWTESQSRFLEEHSLNVQSIIAIIAVWRPSRRGRAQTYVTQMRQESLKGSLPRPVGSEVNQDLLFLTSS